MSFRFNMLLTDMGIDPAEVRLLRHQPVVCGKPLIDVWRNNLAEFEAYQSYQTAGQRASFARHYWASFIGTWDGRTLFVGLYEVGMPTQVEEPFTSPISLERHEARTYDRYPASASALLEQLRGRLYIEWGGGPSGKRAWSQRAEAQDKVISQLCLDAVERPFPGLMNLTLPLSALADAPTTWVQALASSRGVYLLTCPRDGGLYVGSATAEGGFHTRWEQYRANGHGGNVALIGREPSDFIVSILQVAGSTDSSDDILAAEAIWKRKLASRELGLNRN